MKKIRFGSMACAQVYGAFLLSALGVVTAGAQEKKAPTDSLEEVVVTGSLIPRATQTETSVMMTTLSAVEMQERGFATVAEALQQSQFSVGSVQGAQFSGGFTQGAQTLSMFGLSPSYVKYLIDGRPMSDYPALYNGTDTITNISNIPQALVERIDILPGGQSSLYGSDAIAGVINVVLKKKMDGATFDVRAGAFSEGGGQSHRFAFADGVSVGKLDLIGGIQYEKTKPIWGYQRGPTNQFYTGNPNSPQQGEFDFGAYSPYTGNNYLPAAANNCANVSNLYHGTMQTITDPVYGSYCGTRTAGYTTISNGNEAVQAYLHASLDVNKYVNLYADALLSHEITQFNGFLGGYFSGYSRGLIYDPRVPDVGNTCCGGVNLDSFLAVQRLFTPEEIGGLDNSLDPDTTNAARFTFGSTGSIGDSHWSYDLGATYTQQKLREVLRAQSGSKLNAYFDNIIGPSTGDVFGAPIVTPNWAAFYTPIPTSTLESWAVQAVTQSRTADGMLRGQVTNSELFKLAGGDAGIALVAEAAHQLWRYDPDPRLFPTGGLSYSEIYPYTASGSSAGDRTRYALTSEIRLPVHRMVTINASARYDHYKILDATETKSTYNVGIEFRPLASFMLRGRIGTAFKAPTLSDLFQGQSGFFTTATDYYQCVQGGYTFSTCPRQFTQSVFGTTGGNTSLQPINAKVWDAGFVWAPTPRASLTVDYLHWVIGNEVAQQNIDQLLRTEATCRLANDTTTPSCVAAETQVSRNIDGTIASIADPKQNVANEAVNALVASAKTVFPLGRFGSLSVALDWNDMLKHTNQRYAGDAIRDALRDPTWSTDFKSKTTLSGTWNLSDWSTTLYLSQFGRTPNYNAQVGGYSVPDAGTVHEWTLANLSLRYRMSEHVQIAANIVNVLNTMPPEDHTTPGYRSYPYNIFNYGVNGREFFVEATYKFNH